MSIWDHGDGVDLVPPGTPDVKIRQDGAVHAVLADGVQVHRTAEGYHAAHRWCQNTYRLTSTPMTLVYADYEQSLEAGMSAEERAAVGNRFRKQQ